MRKTYADLSRREYPEGANLATFMIQPMKIYWRLSADQEIAKSEYFLSEESSYAITSQQFLRTQDATAT